MLVVSVVTCVLFLIVTLVLGHMVYSFGHRERAKLTATQVLNMTAWIGVWELLVATSLVEVSRDWTTGLAIGGMGIVLISGRWVLPRLAGRSGNDEAPP